jgi:hypothetical protein
MLPPVVLRKNINPLENDWTFKVVNIPRPYTTADGRYYGLHISFSPEMITLSLEPYSPNRVLQNDNQYRYVLASFGALRFKDRPAVDNVDYIKRFLKKGLTINGRRFLFYGHSQSQLRSRSCFLREGSNEDELHARILAMGDFSSIKSVAKR